MQVLYKESSTSKLNTVKIFDRANVPSANLQVSVIVPAKNEAVNLDKTLDALRLQTDISGKPLDGNVYEVLLLANNCSDDTVFIAKNYQQKFPGFPLHIASITLPPKQANIGFVRRLLMDEAYRRLTMSGNKNGIIASTDSDTEVDRCWIDQIVREVESGCDAVGGRILTCPEQSFSRIYHLRDVAYRTLLAQAESMIDPEAHDPWPRHFQYYGASMAVTCSAYSKAGRLPQVPHLEDDALYQALVRMDLRVRKSTTVKAYTSTRLDGRVKIGFSEQLQKWSRYRKKGFVQEVEPAEAWLTKFRCRHALRKCRDQYMNDGFYDRQALKDVAKELFLNEIWLHKELIGSLYFGQLWENVRKKLSKGSWPKRWDLVYISQAISDLRAFVNNGDKIF